MRILSFLILLFALFFVKQQTKSPHGSAFKTGCGTCHSSKGWNLDASIYSFDHNTTKLPLAGQHKETGCRLCHKSLVFTDARTECIDCHADIHQATAGSDCARCHTPASWLVNNISEIHRMGRFPLLGAHTMADCADCHKSESLARFDVMGVDCIDCHRNDYNSTTSPDHRLAGFSEDCSTCHPVNSTQWSGAGFSHSFFALVQGHSTAQCTDCHTAGNYSDASPECNSCHQQDYLSTTNPNHAASSFPVTCNTCHSLTPGWKPASFDHSSFPLTLGHDGPACAECHTGGNYSSTPTDCYACHQNDYNNSVNPGHRSLGFSTNCTECHTTNPDWKPARYTQHDKLSFPIYTGRHAKTWDACNICHPSASNYSAFTCLSCHEHNKTEMDSRHQGESGYSYDSPSCLRCHPTGTAGD